MSRKLTVTVSARVDVEFDITEDEFEDGEALAAHAREVWREEARSLPDSQLPVSIDDYQTEGKFGTAEKAETEQDMLARMQREAEEAAGLV